MKPPHAQNQLIKIYSTRISVTALSVETLHSNAAFLYETNVEFYLFYSKSTIVRVHLSTNVF